jgi:hypothetical protein
MAMLVELASWEYPHTSEVHALVISSATPPVEGCSIRDHRHGRLFFATVCDRDIAIMVKRATVWADARGFANVYLKRESKAS